MPRPLQRADPEQTDQASSKTEKAHLENTKTQPFWKIPKQAVFKQFPKPVLQFRNHGAPKLLFLFVFLLFHRSAHSAGPFL